MDQETPTLHDGVCIGIPVAPGYAAPPPLTTTRAPVYAAPPPLITSGEAAPRLPTTVSESSTVGQQEQYQYIISAAWDRVIHVSVIALIIILMMMYCVSPLFLVSSFNVEQLSVFVSNSSYDNTTTAHWNIRLSVETGNNRFKYPDLDVLLRCNASGDWSTAVVRPSNRDENNTTSLIATVNTLLPQRSSFQGLVLEVDLMLRVKFKAYTIQALCEKVTVGFPSSDNQGFMEEGPRPCSSHTSIL